MARGKRHCNNSLEHLPLRWRGPFPPVSLHQISGRAIYPLALTDIGIDRVSSHNKEMPVTYFAQFASAAWVEDKARISVSAPAHCLTDPGWTEIFWTERLGSGF